MPKAKSSGRGNFLQDKNRECKSKHGSDHHYNLKTKRCVKNKTSTGTKRVAKKPVGSKRIARKSPARKTTTRKSSGRGNFLHDKNRECKAKHGTTFHYSLKSKRCVKNKTTTTKRASPAKRTTKRTSTSSGSKKWPTLGHAPRTTADCRKLLKPIVKKGEKAVYSKGGCEIRKAARKSPARKSPARKTTTRKSSGSKKVNWFTKLSRECKAKHGKNYKADMKTKRCVKKST